MRFERWLLKDANGKIIFCFNLAPFEFLKKEKPILQTYLQYQHYYDIEFLGEQTSEYLLNEKEFPLCLGKLS
jgi:hypothetical protein